MMRHLLRSLRLSYRQPLSSVPQPVEGIRPRGTGGFVLPPILSAAALALAATPFVATTQGGGSARNEGRNDGSNGAVQGELSIVARPTTLRAAPEGQGIATLPEKGTVEVLARDRGWTRVRVEGWVRDADLLPADTSLHLSLSAADLRADPEGTRGKVVLWKVEFLALQTADPLRPGLADQEPYILARGPGKENAILYLVVPPSLISTARALQALSKLTVTARVRNGRSEPAGIPILDLQTIQRDK